MEGRSWSCKDERSRRTATEKCVRVDHERIVPRMFGIDPGKFSVCDQGWGVDQLSPSRITYNLRTYAHRPSQYFSPYQTLRHRRRNLRGVSIFLSLGPAVSYRSLTIKQRIGLSGERTVVLSTSSAQLRSTFSSIMGQLTLVRFRVGRQSSCNVFTHGR